MKSIGLWRPLVLSFILSGPARAHGVSLAFLTSTTPAPPNQPSLGSLVAGFVLLVIGLAVLTVRRHREPLQSPAATRRAVMYAVVYGLCISFFARVIGAALLGTERSPWLLALADVLFVTRALFIWVMVLAEGHSLRDYGFRRTPAARLMLTTVMGIGAVAVYAAGPYRAILMDQVKPTADTLVFALLYSAIGSALPDEILYRGYLMSSLDGRVGRWARVAIPALIFTAIHAIRFTFGLVQGVADLPVYVFGIILPLGLLWGLMRELSGGSLWPSLISHVLLVFGSAYAGMRPVFP